MTNSISNLYKDGSGKVCGAKTAYMLTLGIFLLKFLVSGFTIGSIRAEQMTPEMLTAMGIFLGVVAGAYWGRSKTKVDK